MSQTEISKNSEIARVFPYDLFLSHNNETDLSDIVVKLESIGLKVWHDNYHHLPRAELVNDEVGRAIAKSRFVCICLTTNSFRNSIWCRAEYEPALRLEIETKTPRVIGLSLGNPSLSNIPGLTRIFSTGTDELNRLAAFVALHNHYSIMPQLLRFVVDESKNIKLQDYSEVFSENQLKTKYYTLSEPKELERKVNSIDFWENENLSWELNRVTQTLANYMEPYRLLAAPEVIDLLSETSIKAYNESSNSDVRANALYIAIWIATLDSRSHLSCAALDMISAESSMSLLDYGLYYHKLCLEKLKHSPATSQIRLIEVKYNCLKMAESLFRNKIHPRYLLGELPLREIAILWYKWAKEICEIEKPEFRQEKQDYLDRIGINMPLVLFADAEAIYFEDYAIRAFRIVFDSIRTPIAKRRILDPQAKKEIFDILASAFEQLLAMSELHSGWPFVEFEGLYSDYILPIYAYGLENDYETNSGFKTIVTRSHNLLRLHGKNAHYIPVYEYFLTIVSSESPTTFSMEFSLAMINVEDTTNY